MRQPPRSVGPGAPCFPRRHGVNEEKRTLTLMRPTAQRLPKPAILIVTSERYADE